MSKTLKTAESAAWKAARDKAVRSMAAMTPAEDAGLTAAALADPENPPLTGRRRSRPASEAVPQIVAAYEAGTLWRRGQRGPQKAATKRKVSLRMDPDVLDHYRATGDGWQSRINDTLRRTAKLKAPV